MDIFPVYGESLQLVISSKQWDTKLHKRDALSVNCWDVICFIIFFHNVNVTMFANTTVLFDWMNDWLDRVLQLMRVGKLACLNENRARIKGKFSRITLCAFDPRPQTFSLTKLVVHYRTSQHKWFCRYCNIVAL